MGPTDPLPTGTKIIRLGAVLFLDPTTHAETHAVEVEDRGGVWFRVRNVCPLHPDIIPDLLRDHSFEI